MRRASSLQWTSRATRAVVLCMNTTKPYAQAAPPSSPPPRLGRAGESQIHRLLRRAGWHAGKTHGSGGPGSRSDNKAFACDLWARCGDARLRIEVKHYKNEPRTMQALRGGCDVLAYICKDTGKMAVFIDEALFCDLLAWSAEALSEARR